MSEPTAEKHAAALPADDGAIAGALAELDTKLAAWLTAMRAGQTALLDGVDRTTNKGGPNRDRSTAGQNRDRSTAGQNRDRSTAGQNRDRKRAEEKAPAEQAPAAASDRKRGSADGRGSKLFDGQVPAVPAAERAPQTFGRSLTVAVRTSAAPPPTTDDAVLPDEDETLLASLDAQTARAIQVKRRLAGNKRSVRELLAEIRSEQTPVKDKDSQPARWWRRGHERHDG